MSILHILAGIALQASPAAEGKVVLLDGSPVPGATIRVGTDSVHSSADGSFSVARSSGVARAPTAARRSSPGLSASGGRLSLSWNGSDALGRGVSAPAEVRRPVLRSLAGSDTLAVYWKGKRLVALPLPSDTGDLAFRIDTAWSDDAGVPWNAHVAYGSLFDARDGASYRTVKIGARTWMAENLRSRGSSDSVGAPAPVGLGRYYRLSEWSDGLCPGSGWRLPRSADWDSLILALLRTSMGNGDGTRLKSTATWDSAGSGSDEVGFRGLPAGMSLGGSVLDRGQVGLWGLARDSAHIPMLGRLLHDMATIGKIDTSTTAFGVSLRCLQD